MAFEGVSGPVSAHAEARDGRFARLGLVGLYTGTLLLAALLLFGVQPMFTKRVLPILGGSPAVWSVAMVVFQGLLLAGYAYAHALTCWLNARAAFATHVLVLLAGFAFLPVSIAAGFGAPPAEAEAPWLIGLFLASIGLPFFALTASAPLLQAWFSRSGNARSADPYFLYRASNTGSFAALIAYPLLAEPWLGLDAQGWLWSAGYALLTCAVVACGIRLDNRPAAQAVVPGVETSVDAPPRRLAWVGLSAVPSGLLVAATAHISTDVAAIPLIWVVPLALYLVSFILAFRPVRDGSAARANILGGLQVAGASFVFCGIFLKAPFLLDLAVTLGLLLVNAVIAHRAVYALRPPAARLTEFYLCTSLGGMLGGVFVALIAPRIFSGLYEYPLLVACALACRPGLAAGGSVRLRVGLRWGLLWIAGAGLAALAAAMQGVAIGLAVLLISLTLGLIASWRTPARAALLGAGAGFACILLQVVTAGEGGQHRSFFGLHRIQDSPDGRFRLLSHGTTIHGAMRLRADDGTSFVGPPEPATYYAPGGPLADLVAVSRRASGSIPAISVVGLGAGSLACYAKPGEAWTFYEIDPAVIRIARDAKLFRFLSECTPDARIVQGDARLTLARDRDRVRVLVIDAFSSDAIPMHLMTGEALDLYFARLDAQGVLALHISNRHFELRHVLARLAAERGLTLLHRADPKTEPVERNWRTPSRVALLSRDPAVIREAQALGWRTVTPDLSRRPWSDDYANVLEAMRDRMRTDEEDAAR